jgi:hypothetical protein
MQSGYFPRMEPSKNVWCNSDQARRAERCTLSLHARCTIGAIVTHPGGHRWTAGRPSWITAAGFDQMDETIDAVQNSSVGQGKVKVGTDRSR